MGAGNHVTHFQSVSIILRNKYFFVGNQWHLFKFQLPPFYRNQWHNPWLFFIFYIGYMVFHSQNWPFFVETRSVPCLGLKRHPNPWKLENKRQSLPAIQVLTDCMLSFYYQSIEIVSGRWHSCMAFMSKVPIDEVHAVSAEVQVLVDVHMTSIITMTRRYKSW